MNPKTPRQLRKEWEKDRAEFAAKWFDGDDFAAFDFLESLPYSEIPGWYSANAVMETLAEQGRLKEKDGA